MASKLPAQKESIDRDLTAALTGAMQVSQENSNSNFNSLFVPSNI